MVRYCLFLEKKNINYLAFCIEGSYIHNDLISRGIYESKICALNIKPDYYYLNHFEKKAIIDSMLFRINLINNVRILSFCMRDVYIAFDLSKKIEFCSITHLILHIEDDLYVGQTIFNKLLYKLTGQRKFSYVSNIIFNRKLLKIINSKSGLISMAVIMNKYWKQQFQIQIDDSNIVPLPLFNFNKEKIDIDRNNKKILWIGRIVDFKIPSLIEMINFIKNSEYSLTIVGDGKLDKIKSYVKKNKIELNKIIFLGQVDYKFLPQIIKEHSIGYAMGTSLVELAQFKMPVIIALASYNHKLFNCQICGGLFYDKELGCDGSQLIFTNIKDVKFTISDAIHQIENHYGRIASLCFNYVEKNYSEDINFIKYTEIINKTDFINTEEKKMEIPLASILRKILFYNFKKC